MTRERIQGQMRLVYDLRAKAAATTPVVANTQIGREDDYFVRTSGDASLVAQWQDAKAELARMVASYRPTTAMTRREWNHEEE